MAKSGINKVILVGNLGQDPEIRQLSDGSPVASLSVATSESWRDKSTGEPREQTEWHRLVCYRKLAEIVQNYLKKGSKIYVEGRLRTRKWQDQNGRDRYTTEIQVDELLMLDSRRDNPLSAGKSNPADPSSNYPSGSDWEKHQPPLASSGFDPTPLEFDDEVPF